MGIRNQVLAWLKTSDYLSELKIYISLPSRSRNKAETRKCAEFASKLLQSVGFDSKLIETTGNPVIYGESLAGDSYPTVLLYGHYDVQPEGNIDEWNTPPFTATVIGDKLFARGSADNKGQHYAHILALRYLRSHNASIFENLNIKLILDGDEELGSYSLPEIIKKNVELLKADFVFVSDGPSLVNNVPSIVGAVRGIISFQIRINHNPTDLHSGNFGGVARSATLDLVKLLNSMVNDQGKVLIPGFYDDIEEATENEEYALQKLEPVYDTIISDRNLTRAPFQDKKSTADLNEKWPTFNINGIMAGGVKENRRTIIPSEVYASIDCRLVANMMPNKVKDKIQSHINDWTIDKGIKNAVFVEFEHSMAPVSSSLNSPFIEPIKTAVKIGFNKSPILVPSLGGSLPIALFSEYLDIPVFLVPYALPDENNHAPNENLDIPFFESGVVTTVALLKNLANQL